MEQILDYAVELLRAFDQSLCRRLTELLAPHLAADQLDGIVETIVVFTEGLLGRLLPTAERNRRLTTALIPPRTASGR